jgi:hypothetical protein
VKPEPVAAVIVPLPMPPVVDSKAEPNVVAPRAPRSLEGAAPDVFVQSAFPAFVSMPEDTLRRHLTEYSQTIDSRSRWQIPCSFLVPLVLVFVVVQDFRGFGKVSADTVEGFIGFCTFACGIWLLRELWRLTRRPITVEDLINKCRASMKRRDET